MLQQLAVVLRAATSALVNSFTVEVGVGVGVGVGSGVDVGEVVAATDEVGLGVDEVVEAGVGVGLVAGVGVLRRTIPRFHCNFFPCLTQVNSRPLEMTFVPTFLQGAPALGAAAWAGETREIKRKRGIENAVTSATRLRTSRV